MSQGIIRTPIEAHGTFKDDPLRVLRAIRFAGRLRFDIDQELVDAAKDSEVQYLLDHKVSRERIGTEIGKMFTAGDSSYAMRLLCEWGYYPLVFEIPKEGIISNLIDGQKAQSLALESALKIWT